LRERKTFGHARAVPNYDITFIITLSYFIYPQPAIRSVYNNINAIFFSFNANNIGIIHIARSVRWKIRISAREVYIIVARQKIVNDNYSLTVFSVNVYTYKNTK